MFIKKDLRKVDEILSDSKDTREVLKLSKRSSEFQGSVKAICRESVITSLCNLRVLNLYDNSLTNLNGIGLLSQTPIEEINLGCNKLSTLPLEFGSLVSLKALWLDDNEFELFPSALCQLKNLISLRMSGNSIKVVPPLVSSLSSLETMALDNNLMEEFPEGVLKLTQLKHLWLRQNKLSELPHELDKLKELQTLSISSNQLTTLPECLVHMKALVLLYANGNRISSVPDTLCYLPKLKELNLSNNLLQEFPVLWKTSWQIEELPSNGIIQVVKDGSEEKIKISVFGNPIK